MARKKKIRIPFPKHGYSGYLLHGETPKGVTQDAANVFGEYPGTKRQQGGQRPGLTRKTAAPLPGGRVQAGISVSHAQAPFDFEQLSGLDPLGVPYPLVSDEWSKVAAQRSGALDVRVDEVGNTYWLTDDGIITKRNSDGIEVYSAVLPLTATIRACPRILLVPGGVVAAGSSNGSGSEAVLWKFEEREDRDGLDLTAALILEANAVIAIELQGSAIMVAVRGAGSISEVLTILGVAGVDLAISVRHAVPHPVGDIAVGPRGVYATSHPNVERGETPAGEGFQTPAVDWIPNDLILGEQRVHAWYDADFAGTDVDGAPASRWVDYRLSGEVPVPDDETDRSLEIPVYGRETGNPGPNAPIWGQFSVGPSAGLTFRPESSTEHSSFSGGDALYTSTLNMTNLVRRSTKATAAGSLPASRGLWPINSGGYKFAISIVLRWKEGASPSVAWTVGSLRDGDDPSTSFFGWSYDGLFLTVNDAGNDLSKPFWLTGIPVDPVDQLDGGICLRGICLNNPIAVESGVATSFGPDPLRMAIVTIVNNGPLACELRVNGAIEATGFTIDDTVFKSNSELFGSRYTTRLNPVISDATSFDGVLASAVTIMGASGAAVHDTNVSLAEIQLLEGYLAHRYGCQTDALDSVLPHPYRVTIPSGSGTLPGVGETEAALRSKYGILAKLDPSGKGAVWAIAGAGLGYSVIADEEGGVVATGPQAFDPTIAYPVTQIGPLLRTALKVVDRGLTVDAPLPSTGVTRISGIPTTGDWFILHDGIASETFEWWDGVSPQAVPGSTLVEFGGDSYGTVAAALLKITVSTTINMDGDFSGALDSESVDLLVFSREAPTGVANPITLSSTGNVQTVISGMTAAVPYPTGVWALQSSHLTNYPLYDSPRTAIDQDGKVYIPVAIAVGSNTVMRLNGDTGILEVRHEVGGPLSDYPVHSIAIDQNHEELLPARGPEFMWAAMDNVDGLGVRDEDRGTQYKIKWIGSEPNGEPNRTTTNLVVSGGVIYEIDSLGAATALELTPSFHPTTAKVISAELFGEVFFCDNGIYRAVNLRTKEVKVWEPDTAGEMPDDAQLMVPYRGRMVFARTKTDAHGLYASAHGDPYDWDVGRSLTEITGAFQGTSTKRNPDMVQALCPFYDDFLVIGGASSITQLRGDLSAAGSIDLFTTATGMAFGDSYALAPNGLLYFFGSRGGVWVMQPGTDGRANPPVEITEQTVGRELGEIDLSIYAPRLVWDTERKGLHVILVYTGVGASPAPVRHWFFSDTKKAWWPVEFGSSLALPSAVWTRNGDLKDDRTTMLGWSDGHLREWDDDSASDDGVAIDSYILLGPIGDTEREYGIFEILASVSQVGAGIRFEVFASDDPEELGLPIHSGTLSTGFSGSIMARGRGSSLWIRLVSAKLDESWGLNDLGITLADMGARRNR